MSEQKPWEKYSKQQENAGPWAKYKDKAQETKKTAPNISQTESGLRGYAQGLTSDSADEITATAESLVTDKTRDQALAESRAAYRAAQEANPITYGTGEVAGGATQFGLQSLVPVLRAGSVAKNLGMAAASGALQGYGASESENPMEQAKDTGKGLGIGLLFGAGGEIVGRAPGHAKAYAENRAAAALGAERGTINKFGPNKVRAAGRVGLDEGTVSLLAGTPEMVVRNQIVKDRGWEMMDGVFKKIDETGERYISPLDVATKIEDKIGGFYRSPINRAETTQLENTLESVLMRGDQNIGLSKAHELQKELGKVAKWGYKDPSDKELMAREAYFVVSDEIEKATELAMQRVNDPVLLRQLQEGKKLYSASKTTEEMLTNRNAREQGNKMTFGLTDTIAGGFAWEATKDPMAVLAALAAKRAAERYGNQVGAIAGNYAQKGLNYVPQSLGKAAPGVWQGVIRGAQSPAISSSKYDGPDLSRLQGTKYEAQMQQMMAEDPQKAAVWHYLYSTRDPEYSAVMNGQKKNEYPTKVRPIGEQIGDLVDQSTWTDKIGLDPQEKRSNELMDVQQLPSLGMAFPPKNNLINIEKRLSKSKFNKLKEYMSDKKERTPEEIADFLEEQDWWHNQEMEALKGPLSKPEALKNYNKVLNELDKMESQLNELGLLDKNSLLPNKYKNEFSSFFENNETKTVGEQIEDVKSGIRKITRARDAMENILKK